MLETIRSSLTSSQFLTGLSAGGAALVVGLSLGLVWKRRGGMPLVGLLWSGAALIALVADRGVPRSIVLGVGTLALGGLGYTLLTHAPLLSPLLAIPGAWIVALETEMDGPSWVPWLVLTVIVLGAPLAAHTDRRIPLGTGILMWVVTIGGIYATVPDTEEALILLGAMVPLTLLGFLQSNKLGAIGIFAGTGLLGWATASGGVGRPASIVGGLATLGVFLVVPLAARIGTKALDHWPVVLMIHAGVVAINSRVAGLRTSVIEAAAISVGGLLLALLALVAAGRLRSVRDPDSRASPSSPDSRSRRR